MSSNEPQKVVVRLLPPEIMEEEFKATVPQVHKDHVKWWSFQAGKRYKGEAKPSLNSRCYLQFETAVQAVEFMNAYHGHQFIDGQGETFRAVACIAPYQKVPKKSQKDPREGTILDDSEYKQFLERLQEKVQYEPPADPKASLRPLDAGDTPLLNFMKTRALERRARWDRKQNKKWVYSEQAVEEQPRRPKWRCSECGTSKHLEEDPDDRGTFYCTYCWEHFESQQSAAPKAKKKKKAKEEAWGETWEEPEEASAKKKKKKKKDKEKEEYEEAAHKSEWREKQTSSSWTADAAYEEDADKRQKKKKKDKEEEAAWAEASDSRWRATQASEGWSEQPAWGEEKKARPKAKGSSKDDTWWEEPAEEKSESRSARRPERHERPEEGGARRWRAKAPAAEVSSR